MWSGSRSSASAMRSGWGCVEENRSVSDEYKNEMMNMCVGVLGRLLLLLVCVLSVLLKQTLEKKIGKVWQWTSAAARIILQMLRFPLKAAACMAVQPVLASETYKCAPATNSSWAHRSCPDHGQNERKYIEDILCLPGLPLYADKNSPVRRCVSTLSMSAQPSSMSKRVHSEKPLKADKSTKQRGTG